MDNSLTKSDLIESLARNQNHLALRDVELAVKSLLEKMSQELATGERIEIRGFGSFSLHFRPARMGRNPKSGDAVALSGKYVPHFKPGKELRERVNYINTDPSKVGQSRQKMEERLKKQASQRSADLDRQNDRSLGRALNNGSVHSNAPIGNGSTKLADNGGDRSSAGRALGQGRQLESAFVERSDRDNSSNNDS